jgi:hypothetical protein
MYVASSELGTQILVERQRWFLADEETRILDLSSMTFDQFVEFFFAREVVPDEQQFAYFLQDLSGQKFDEAVPSSPSVIIEHMTRLCTEFARIAPRYSLPQLDQGIWGILGGNLRLYEFLWDSSIPLKPRIQCIRSMYSVFSDFVATSKVEVMETGFYMWWDLILHGFWSQWKLLENHIEWGHASKLDTESRLLLDVMFETLKSILEISDAKTQDCALHGLGHLHHPGVRETVQKFIDHNKIGVTEKRLQWLEGCRDGKIM